MLSKEEESTKQCRSLETERPNHEETILTSKDDLEQRTECMRPFAPLPPVHYGELHASSGKPLIMHGIGGIVDSFHF